jgi:hypothetical protein
MINNPIITLIAGFVLGGALTTKLHNQSALDSDVSLAVASTPTYETVLINISERARVNEVDSKKEVSRSIYNAIADAISLSDDKVLLDHLSTLKIPIPYSEIQRIDHYLAMQSDVESCNKALRSKLIINSDYINKGDCKPTFDALKDIPKVNDNFHGVLS